MTAAVGDADAAGGGKGVFPAVVGDDSSLKTASTTSSSSLLLPKGDLVSISRSSSKVSAGVGWLPVPAEEEEAEGWQSWQAVPGT